MKKPITKVLNAIAVAGMFALVFPVLSKPARAACNFHSSMTTSSQNVSNWSTTCTIAGVEGIDNALNTEGSVTNTAVLTLSSGSITINNGGVLLAQLSLTGGSIAIQAGGIISPSAPMYVVDADADGWPSAFTFYTATASGKRRLSLMRSFTTVDCNDSSYSVANTCCTANGGACSADGTCCSSICGTNADSDSYFSLSAGHTGTCQASALPYTDCYDSNANAYPGSTTCSGTNRGDGSYDYNCSGGNTTCGNTYYTPVARCVANPGSLYCPCNVYFTGISTAVGCGVSGNLDAGSSTCGGGMCSVCYTNAGGAGTQGCQ